MPGPSCARACWRTPRRLFFTWGDVDRYKRRNTRGGAGALSHHPLEGPCQVARTPLMQRGGQAVPCSCEVQPQPACVGGVRVALGGRPPFCLSSRAFCPLCALRPASQRTRRCAQPLPLGLALVLSPPRLLPCPSAHPRACMRCGRELPRLCAAASSYCLLWSSSEPCTINRMRLAPCLPAVL